MLESHIHSKTYRSGLSSVLKKYKRSIEGHVSKDKTHNPSMVYANNYLNYGELKVIGFDLDYTLVNYTVELQNLIYSLAQEVLINKFGYPQDLNSFKFDPKFAIRGLSVDARYGVLSKLSHLQRMATNRSYRGKTPLSPKDMEAFYGDRHVPHGDLSQMRPLNDLFSVAEGCLIADTMELFLHRQKTTAESFVASSIVDDVQQAISEVHINGSMQTAVLSDPERYIKKSPQLGGLLEHVQQSGKQSFLCTNSGYTYSNQALNHALGLKPTSVEWRGLFDVVICSAKKPDFYKTRLPFRHFDTVRRSPTTAPVNKLEKGNVYVYGSADALQRATGWSGNEVMYLGDNLRADLSEARRWHGWHTGCVLGELEEEITTQHKPECQELHFLRSTLRNMMFDLQAEMQRPQVQEDSDDEEGVVGTAAPLGCAYPDSCHNIDANSCNSLPSSDPNTFLTETLKPCAAADCLKPGQHYQPQEEILLRTIEGELQAINTQLSKLFNPNFGSVFRTDGHPSLFAFSVLRYVDLYMSDVCNLVNYNPLHRFYPYHSMHMAHDPASLSGR